MRTEHFYRFSDYYERLFSHFKTIGNFYFCRSAFSRFASALNRHFLARSVIPSHIYLACFSANFASSKSSNKSFLSGYLGVVFVIIINPKLLGAHCAPYKLAE